MGKLLLGGVALLAGVAGFLLGRGWQASTPVSAAPAVNVQVSDGGIYRVRAVVDGDTIVLENGLHLRYSGVNTPESGRWVKDASPFSKEATARNAALVEGKRVRVKLGRDVFDPHGRVVGTVFVVPETPGEAEIDVRQALIREGLGKVMYLGIDGAEYGQLKQLQDDAKRAHAGIWGATAPADGASANPFCASSNSKTYHRCDCTLAARISPANLHTYATAEEAEAAGLKPCATCLKK
jgi:micrococcal nuclease